MTREQHLEAEVVILRSQRDDLARELRHLMEVTGPYAGLAVYLDGEQEQFHAAEKAVYDAAARARHRLERIYGDAAQASWQHPLIELNPAAVEAAMGSLPETLRDEDGEPLTEGQRRGLAAFCLLAASQSQETVAS